MRLTNLTAFDSVVGLAWVAVLFSYAQAFAAEPQTIGAHGVSLTFEPKSLTTVQLLEQAAKPAKPDDPMEPFGGATALPAHLVFVATCTRNERCGSVSLTPARGERPERFIKAYPRVAAHVGALEQLLKERPEIPTRTSGTIWQSPELPTLRFKNAGQTFLSKVEYLTFPWGSAVAYLAQYAQDASDWAVGYNLIYEVHGLTDDGAICVSAEFTAAHRLARGSEEKRTVEEVTGQTVSDQQYAAYLSRMERLLGAQPNDSFQPPLNAIHDLLNGIDFRQAKPRRWDSRFKDQKLTLSPK